MIIKHCFSFADLLFYIAHTFEISARQYIMKCEKVKQGIKKGIP